MLYIFLSISQFWDTVVTSVFISLLIPFPDSNIKYPGKYNFKDKISLCVEKASSWYVRRISSLYKKANQGKQKIKTTVIRKIMLYCANTLLLGGDLRGM